jgi:hypothetical protein
MHIHAYTHIHKCITAVLAFCKAEAMRKGFIKPASLAGSEASKEVIQTIETSIFKCQLRL